MTDALRQSNEVDAFRDRDIGDTAKLVPMTIAGRCRTVSTSA
jgi:hypothetical protein